MGWRILLGAFYPSSHCRRLLRGARERLQSLAEAGTIPPVELLLHLTYDRFLADPDRESFDGAVLYGNYWQVIHGLPHKGYPRFAGFGIPFVNVSGRYVEGAGAQVLQDDLAVGRRAARLLGSRGARALAYMGFSGEVGFSGRREAGFVAEAARLGLPLRPFVHRQPDAHREQRLALRDEVVEWAASLPDGTGIFAANDDLAVEVAGVANHAGRRIPEEILLLGAENDPDRVECLPGGISSVDVGAEAVGAAAGQELAMALLEGREPRPGTIDAAHVVERRSTDRALVGDPVLERLVQAMRRDPRLPDDLDALAARFGLGRRTLERRFKVALGMSPLAYLQALRLDRARQLLATTDLKLAQVAAEAGFGDEKWFQRLFRREVGVTPATYRRDPRPR